ncbi:STAS/SEC14 domain-containing protein [Paenarthrobacter sp. DKR-5]|nr:STAS/SEC14 domain-containing protein [Paenarthrobacter sp. DKR-5]
MRAANGKNTLIVRNGVIESLWRPGSAVDVEEARDAIHAAAALAGGRPMPMLSEMSDVVITAAARRLFAQATHVSAIAVLGSNDVDRAVAAAVEQEAGYPHRFFSSRAAALAWLQALA